MTDFEAADLSDWTNEILIDAFVRLTEAQKARELILAELRHRFGDRTSGALLHGERSTVRLVVRNGYKVLDREGAEGVLEAAGLLREASVLNHLRLTSLLRRRPPLRTALATFVEATRLQAFQPVRARQLP